MRCVSSVPNRLITPCDSSLLRTGGRSGLAFLKAAVYHVDTRHEVLGIFPEGWLSPPRWFGPQDKVAEVVRLLDKELQSHTKLPTTGEYASRDA